MKKRPGAKRAIAIAIIQHPAVQEAAKKIGKAGLRKAQAWWEARKASGRIALKEPKAVKKSTTARKRKPATTPPAAAKAKKKTAARKRTARKRGDA